MSWEPKFSIPMPRVNPIVTECPKCGTVCEDDSVSVSSEQVYDPKDRKWTEVRRTIRATISTTYVKLHPGAKCLCGRSDEHLHRKCFICGFYWSTETVSGYFDSNAAKIDRAITEDE
jgi:hypothetical protein